MHELGFAAEPWVHMQGQVYHMESNCDMPAVHHIGNPALLPMLQDTEQQP